MSDETKVLIDFSKLKKGSKIVLADGRTVVVSGVYMSVDGPMLMVKVNPGQMSGENVSLSDVKKFAEA